MKKVIIDVREPMEFRMGHVDSALNIPPSKMLSGMPEELADLPKDTEIVLYCMSGARSGACMNILAAYGFTNLINGINKDHVKAKYC